MKNERGVERFLDEYRGADLGDARLSRRLVEIARPLFSDPKLSFPQAYDAAGLEATYRFCSNTYVQSGAVHGPHRRETIERASGVSTLLAVHDTTAFKFDPDGARRGLGRLRAAGQCFFGHATLAINAESEETLGVLALQTWVRDKEPSDGRERGRWIEQMIEVSELEGLDPSRIIHVADRESDSYDILICLQEKDMRYVLRSSKDRCLQQSIEGTTKLREALRTEDAMLMREVPLTVRSAKGRSKAANKTNPPRNARQAQLSISACRVTLARPNRGELNQLPRSCAVNVVRVWEPQPPPDEPAVEWILFTSEPIDTAEQLETIVDYYRARWRIEEYFKVLKTGCAFEQRQLESYEALCVALAIFVPIAWRMLQMRDSAHRAPEAPASSVLAEDELLVLRAIARTPLKEHPTRRDVLLAIAALGGHLKRNGEPGWITLARGMESFLLRVEGFRIAHLSTERYDQS